MPFKQKICTFDFEYLNVFKHIIVTIYKHVLVRFLLYHVACVLVWQTTLSRGVVIRELCPYNPPLTPWVMWVRIFSVLLKFLNIIGFDTTLICVTVPYTGHLIFTFIIIVLYTDIETKSGKSGL